MKTPILELTEVPSNLPQPNCWGLQNGLHYRFRKMVNIELFCYQHFVERAQRSTHDEYNRSSWGAVNKARWLHESFFDFSFNRVRDLNRRRLYHSMIFGKAVNPLLQGVSPKDVQ